MLPLVAVLDSVLAIVADCQAGESYSFLAIMIQYRYRPPQEVLGKECTDNGAPDPATGGKGVARSPHGVAAVIDVSRKAEKSTFVDFTFVGGVLLELLSLPFGNRLKHDSNNVKGTASDKWSLREMFAIDGCGC